NLHSVSNSNANCICGSKSARQNPLLLGGLIVQAQGLYLHIDHKRLECLNEQREGSGALVFHAWEDRGDRQKFVESDDDEELLFNVPFTGNVKLKGIIVMGEDDGTYPSEMRLFKNIPHMSFGDTNWNILQKLLASQMFIICPSTSPRCAETTKIFYIGLRGEWTEPHRHEVAICNYAAAANPADRKIDQITPETYFIS
uniref:PITH domain-containing protein n=1 Tax=Podarcis muralis TaxID=64176 RepID=A0A670JV29_PODMU